MITYLKYVRPRRMSLALLATLCFSYAGLFQAQAEQTQDTKKLTLGEAIARTLDKNSELQAYPFEVRMLDGELLQAGQKPLPELGAMLENAIGTGELKGLQAAELTVTLSQTFEMGGKRQARRALVGARQRLLEEEYSLARTDILAEVTRRYYHLLHIQKLADITVQQLDARQKARELVSERVTAGAIPTADLSKIELEIADTRLKLRELKQAGIKAATRLAAMWMVKPDFTSAGGRLTTAYKVPDSTILEQVIETTPPYLHAVALTRLSESSLSLALTQNKQDIKLGIGVRRNETLNDQALMFTFSMPLAFDNPNKGRILAARAESQMNAVQQQQVRQKLILSLSELRQKMIADQSLSAGIKSEVRPAAIKLLADAENAYSTGAYSILEWIDAQNKRFELDRRQANTSLSFMMNLLELERITGTALATARSGEK